MKVIILSTLLLLSSLAYSAELLIAFDPPEEGEVTGYQLFARRSNDPTFQLVKTSLVAELHTNAAGRTGIVMDFGKAGQWSVYVIPFYDHVNSDGSTVRIEGPTPLPENILSFHVPGHARNLRPFLP